VNRRVIGLLVAVVLAAIATVLLYMYIDSADDRAAGEFELRRVYVATQRIEAGTSAEAAIAQALIEQRDIPETAVAQGAIGSLDAIQGLVAAVPIAPGQQIVDGSFAETTAVATGTTLNVPEGLQAVSFQLSVLPGIAGFVNAGDRISILSIIDVETGAVVPPVDPEDDQPPPQIASEGLQARYLVQNALVLAVGQRVTRFDDQGRSTGKAIQESNSNYIFTVALEPEEIEKLVFAQSQSTLWATLLPPTEDGEPLPEVTTPGANLQNLFQ
jgi:pilus assembly protein CpaB